MGKYYRARQARDGSIIGRRRFACWITKAADTYSEYVSLFFPSNGGYKNAPEYCVTRTYIVHYLYLLTHSVMEVGNWMPRFQLCAVMSLTLTLSLGEACALLGPDGVLRASLPVVRLFMLDDQFLLSHYSSFLRAFAELHKATISFAMSVRPSVGPHGRTRLPPDGFLWNVTFEYFSKIFRENSSFIKCDKWRSWLRRCVTNREVVGSILNVVGSFHWHNSSGRKQKWRLVHGADNFHVPVFLKSGSLILLEP